MNQVITGMMLHQINSVDFQTYIRIIFYGTSTATVQKLYKNHHSIFPTKPHSIRQTEQCNHIKEHGSLTILKIISLGL